MTSMPLWGRGAPSSSKSEASQLWQTPRNCPSTAHRLLSAGLLPVTWRWLGPPAACVGFMQWACSRSSCFGSQCNATCLTSPCKDAPYNVSSSHLAILMELAKVGMRSALFPVLVAVSENSLNISIRAWYFPSPVPCPGSSGLLQLPSPVLAACRVSPLPRQLCPNHLVSSSAARPGGSALTASVGLHHVAAADMPAGDPSPCALRSARTPRAP